MWPTIAHDHVFLVTMKRFSTTCLSIKCNFILCYIFTTHPGEAMTERGVAVALALKEHARAIVILARIISLQLRSARATMGRS